MNAPMSGSPANPFGRRTVLVMVLLGAALFMALLWMIATGNGFQSSNDGQAHAAGRGLNGYAAMYDYLGRRGYAVSQARSADDLDPEGLLVLTPPADADGKEIDRIVSRHRYNGATLIIAPKWRIAPPSDKQEEQGAQTGWVNLVGADGPLWNGYLEDVTVTVGYVDANGQPGKWDGIELSGELPTNTLLLWGKGPRLIPLVTEMDGRILAVLVDDGGTYPDLEAVAQGRRHSEVDDDELYPVVIVFEPDLLDNYAFADRDPARLLDALIPRMEVEQGSPIVFDMTLNGFGGARNLLTLAFTPPFLAATLCLVLAALLLGWQAFLRFGPATVPDRAIAFGKRALVANSAGLLLRSRRFHLLRAPYIERARERLAKALALSRSLDAAGIEAAIDRALAARSVDAEPFSLVAQRLRQARKPHEILKAARDLHALERTLIQ